MELEQICVGLIKAPITHVRRSVSEQLGKVITKRIAFKLERVAWREFFRERGNFYNIMEVEMALFPYDHDATAYVCNLADGWSSLYENIVNSECFDAFFFRTTLTESAPYRVHEMLGWERGQLRRHLRSLQDDIGWTFIDKGEPLDFEDIESYCRRKISDRLNAQIIKEYSRRAGYKLTDVLSYRGFSYHLKRGVS